MSPHFNWNRRGLSRESDLYGRFIQESIEMYGLDIKYFPILQYDETQDAIWGEDNLPRYRKGMPLIAYYKDVMAASVFSKFGLHVEQELELYIPRLNFERTFPDGLVGVSDYIAPREGDWFETTSGETFYYEVAAADEGDWIFGNFHCFKITAVPRKHSHVEINQGDGIYEASTLAVSATGVSGVAAPPELDISDEVEELAEEIVVDKDTTYWGSW